MRSVGWSFKKPETRFAVIADTVSMKSRKRYAGMLIGLHQRQRK